MTIDWDRVQELRTDVLCEDFAEVVGLFLEEVEEVLDRLNPKTDRAELCEEFHLLKGSALNLGFLEFAQDCHDAEQATANAVPDSALIENIRASYRKSLSVFMSRARDYGLAA